MARDSKEPEMPFPQKRNTLNFKWTFCRTQPNPIFVLITTNDIVQYDVATELRMPHMYSCWLKCLSARFLGAICGFLRRIHIYRSKIFYLKNICPFIAYPLLKRILYINHLYPYNLGFHRHSQFFPKIKINL